MARVSLSRAGGHGWPEIDGPGLLPTTLDDGPATGSSHPAAKTVLAGALQIRRLECAFHEISLKTVKKCQLTPSFLRGTAEHASNKCPCQWAI